MTFKIRARSLNKNCFIIDPHTRFEKSWLKGPRKCNNSSDFNQSYMNDLMLIISENTLSMQIKTPHFIIFHAEMSVFFWWFVVGYDWHKVSKWPFQRTIWNLFGSNEKISKSKLRILLKLLHWFDIKIKIKDSVKKCSTELTSNLSVRSIVSSA